MFIAALFIIAKPWKQPRCPSIGEWINKLLYLQFFVCNGMLFTNNKEWAVKMWKDMMESSVGIAKWKKPV